MDMFFGLMPNLFYAIYKTKLNQAGGKFTVRYFYVNGVIMGILFVILVVTTLTTNEDVNVIASDVILFAVTIYSFCFYLLVIHVLRGLEGRVKRVISRYFWYYCLYAVAIFFRNSFLIGGALTQDNPALIEVSFSNFPVDTISAGVTLMVVALFLKEIKFVPATSHPSNSGKVSTGTTTKDNSTST